MEQRGNTLKIYAMHCETKNALNTHLYYIHYILVFENDPENAFFLKGIFYYTLKGQCR